MNRNFEQGTTGLARMATFPCAEAPFPAAEEVHDLVRQFTRERARERAIRLEERRRERTRIAQELDRRLFQRFLGVSALVEGAVEEMPADEPAKAAAGRALSVIRRVIEEGRKTLAEMGLSDLRSTSLERALAEIADEIAPGGAKVRVSVLGRQRELPPAIADQVYLVAREALVNALRHSEATSIEVEVEYLTARLRLVVRDNGVGIDQEVLERGRDFHWGLQGMRERARGMGAQLRILSRKAAGTEVEMSIPTGIACTYVELTAPADFQSQAVV